MSTSRPLSIVVIGAGPSGLFFCHAMEYMMKQTHQDVSITCYERASQPGGVWRAASATQTLGATEMYANLWTNGASHCNEFFDYTFDEHFGGDPVSVYMKRQDLLDYILGRVQKHTPNFLDKYVRCNTEVQHVIYDEEQQQFKVTTRDLATQQTQVQRFDKCVWACGDNGKQKMPEKLVKVFREGNYKGRLIHSADTANLEDDVRGKRILLVGGGFSAEDLALQAIKLGVKQVYVSCRCSSAEIDWTTNWPMDKVKVLMCQVPTKVTEQGNCIQFQEVTYTFDGYKLCSDEVETELRNIDTVIMCTGYDVNLDMLDESLRSKGIPESGFNAKLIGQSTGRHDVTPLDVPDGWKMSHNVMSDWTGEVAVSDKVWYHTGYVHPDFYKGVMISNPNMMFICLYSSYLPMPACDAYAWLLAGYASGWLELPTREEMQRQNRAEALMELDVPYLRYYMDENYCNAINDLEGFWPDDGEQPDEWEEVEAQEWHLSLKRLAQVMKDGQYPFSLGDYNELNDNGKAMLFLGDLSYYHRENSEASDWKTFRDVDDAHKFYSMHTGTRAAPLEKRWLETEDEEKETSAVL